MAIPSVATGQMGISVPCMAFGKFEGLVNTYRYKNTNRRPVVTQLLTAAADANLATVLDHLQSKPLVPALHLLLPMEAHSRWLDSQEYLPCMPA
jgi:hypothetical protein